MCECVTHTLTHAHVHACTNTQRHTHAHYGCSFQQCNQRADFPLWPLYQRYDSSVKDINWFLMVTLGDLCIGPPAKSPCRNDSVRSLIPLMSPQKTRCGNGVRLSVQIPQRSFFFSFTNRLCFDKQVKTCC